MDALGCELKAEDEPIYGSFFSNLRFIFKDPKTQNEVRDLYKNGKTALKAKHLNLPTAEATEKLTMAASNLITALDNQAEAVIRLGAILMVKVLKDDKSIIIIETISPEIMEELNSGDSILKNPQAVYEMLQKFGALKADNEIQPVNPESQAGASI